MKLSISELPYLSNLPSLLEHFREDEQVALLDSMNSNHKDGRWSIFSASPIKTLETRDTHIQNENFKEKLATLEATLPKIHNQQLPFTGGVIGLLSYDNGILQKGIHSKLPNKPGSPLITAGLYTWAFLWDHHSEKSYLVHWNVNTGYTKDQLLFRFNNPLPSTDNFKMTKAFSPQWSKEQYTRAFETTQKYIQAGDIYQLNLAQKYTGQYSGEANIAYCNLRARAKAPFSVFWKNHNQYLISASPERFILCNNNKIQTRPIKGTRPRSSDPITDKESINALLESKKERAENVMIVDLLRNDISKHATQVSVPSLFEVESYPTVHHLVSTITGKLKPTTTTLNLLFDAFPGGSITGTPKKRAIEIISELEQTPRELYCGSAFYLSTNGRMDSNILIRSFLLEENKISCWAGGGIVADSNLESEYQECLDKIELLMEWLKS